VFIVPVFIQLYRSKSSILLRRYPLGQNKYVMLFFGGWTFGNAINAGRRGGFDDDRSDLKNVA
jgi:hypothetical protein